MCPLMLRTFNLGENTGTLEECFDHFTLVEGKTVAVLSATTI
jgi:hypothetical protein